VHPCLIADLAHVHADTLAMSLAAAADRYILVTDAGPGAGLPPGRHSVGQRANGQSIAVDVVDGACWLPGAGLIGGATSLHGCMRNVISLGRPPLEALDAVTRRPADVLGLQDRGRLLVGERADVVVLDGKWQLSTVLVAGVESGVARSPQP
jgi:N-acetylglucosamine-6-phosphate deacetylase